MAQFNLKACVHAACYSISIAFLSTPVLAQDDANDAAEPAGALEEVITTGTRSSRPRTAADSTAPIDVLSGDDFNAYGGANDITDNMKALVPSYTATPLTGDGSAFVRPTSLRGTAPDQSLVLIDGKRRHRSALLHFFAPAAGNGAHGVDIGMIPGIAIKQVEVLRDGASSQYGADAIAGVINFITKTNNSGGEAFVQYGESYESESSFKAGVNMGFAVGDGFINLSAEYIDNDAFVRSIQRFSDVENLLAAGVDPSLIGADAPFGEAPLLQTWGRPESSGTRVWINSGFDLANDSQLYARVGLADTTGRYRFFYRNPNHASLAPLRDEFGYTGLPAGYTPFLDGDQEDLYAIIGVDGSFGNGTFYDFSVSYGENTLDYFLNNTVNTSLGVDSSGNIPQMDFDVGGYDQEELNFNADFSNALSDNVNLAYGFEWREETYVIRTGEPNAYLGVKTSGYAAPNPENTGKFDRDNWAVYADVEHDISDAFLMQYALRYEDFSDFGDTLNGKIAGRYRFSDAFAMRGAVSTGFHAPTPGQINVSSVITTFDGTTGAQVEEGLVPTTDPRIQALGVDPLQEETSMNYSIGFTSEFGDATSLTVDFYRIEVDDRIYRTGDIPLPPLPSGLETSISFYTNALDLEHQGIDVVLTSAIDWGNAYTSISFAYNYNEVSVTDQTLINGFQPVNDGLVEDIENNYPEHRFVLTTSTSFNDRWDLLVRANYTGSHWDERGRIGAAVDPSANIGSTIYVDAELGFQVTDSFKLALGAVNIFDEYISKVGPPNANRLSVGLEYPRRSAANYEGGQWYLRGSFYWD